MSRCHPCDFQQPAPADNPLFSRVLTAALGKCHHAILTMCPTNAILPSTWLWLFHHRQVLGGRVSHFRFWYDNAGGKGGKLVHLHPTSLPSYKMPPLGFIYSCHIRFRIHPGLILTPTATTSHNPASFPSPALAASSRTLPHHHQLAASALWMRVCFPPEN